MKPKNVKQPTEQPKGKITIRFRKGTQDWVIFAGTRIFKTGFASKEEAENSLGRPDHWGFTSKEARKRWEQNKKEPEGLDLAAKFRVIEKLPEAGRVLKAEVAIARGRLDRAEKDYREALEAIERSFDLEAWRAVQREWTPEEIEAARK